MDEKQKWEEHMERSQRREELYNEQLEAYIAMVKALNCAICSEAGGMMKLLGGRSVPLCAEHDNAWAEFMAAHSLKGQYNDAHAAYDVAIRREFDAPVIAKARACDWQDVIDAIYDLSGEWLEEEKRKWQAR